MAAITDATLCTISYGQHQAKEVRALYSALLELGVNFVQIPACTALLLGDRLVRDRTVLTLSVNDPLLKGFAGYVCTTPVTDEYSICEVKSADKIPEWAEEARVTADASLLMCDYSAVFNRLLTKPKVTFYARDAGRAGTALAVEWLMAGGEGTVLSFMGSGGYAPLEQVLAALHTTGDRRFDLSKFNLVADAWRRLTGQSIPGYSPVVGRHIFDVESGTHVDGIMKNSRCYEPFAPEDVGGQRHIAIGKHSGKSALAQKLKELGINSGCDLDKLLELVREESMKNGSCLSDDELKTLAAAAGGVNAA